MRGLATLFHETVDLFEKKAPHALDMIRDVYVALRKPAAMSEEKRYLNEFKLAAGSILSVAGTCEVNPLTVAGGAIPAWEAVQELQKAGHRYRQSHCLL